MNILLIICVEYCSKRISDHFPVKLFDSNSSEINETFKQFAKSAKTHISR